jgi:hypothetical protein
MMWFGQLAPGATSDFPQVATPTGEACMWCDEAIAETDNGVIIPHLGKENTTAQPWHIECFTRSLVGGVNHLRRQCTCFGGSLTADPPGLSRREAAILSLRHYHKNPDQ